VGCGAGVRADGVPDAHAAPSTTTVTRQGRDTYRYLRREVLPSIVMLTGSGSGAAAMVT
jgi:hypothetical protein